MEEIIVKSQEELDAVPTDKDCIIKIKFGTKRFPAIVSNCYKYRVVAWGNSSVVARENSSVVARENSSVEARKNSSVVARENSSVVAWENSSVVAWENSSVEAWGNSSVVARENSFIVARENVQVVDFLQRAIITLSGNARTVFMPRSIEEFMNFYEIEHDKTTAIFYKAVHKKEIGTICADDGKKFSSVYEYVSDYDGEFKYEIGEMVSSDGFNNDFEEHCGKGIHVSHKSWALDFGRNWGDLALLEVKVKIKDILLPKYSDGKVRVPKVEVIREVPLTECGVYGKILAKRKEKQNAKKKESDKTKV